MRECLDGTHRKVWKFDKEKNLIYYGVYRFDGEQWYRVSDWQPHDRFKYKALKPRVPLDVLEELG